MSLILGIDPGLAHTGWGVIDPRDNRYHLVGHGVISTAAGMAPGARLDRLYTEVTAVLEKYHPAEAGVENLYFAKNATSAIPVAQARGVVLLALERAGVRAAEYTPQAIKQAIVGQGRAEKSQVQALLRVLLGIREVPAPDHAADALAAAVCHIHNLGFAERAFPTTAPRGGERGPETAG
ncbi:MAG: crossover junction endodeoxyribonuclease RuvC [Spirochaetes bacterium]|jgi:crossover junction endodeoxyribonuclease RuvC|nr:crossover junction endodeoxyribonuclease RuvC [Spirochaetota bacterium]